VSIASIKLDGQSCGVATIQDFTTIQKEIAGHEINSYKDTLTGLYNRRYLEKVIEENNRVLSSWENIGVIFIDLNKFKPINDKYGHEVGDSVLVTISKRIESIIRLADIVFRIGGDEFLVFINLTSVSNRNEAINTIANNIYRCVTLPIETENFNESVGLSMGCGLYPDQESNIKALISLADKAMYSAKDKGKKIEYAK